MGFLHFIIFYFNIDIVCLVLFFFFLMYCNLILFVGGGDVIGGVLVFLARTCGVYI